MQRIGRVKEKRLLQKGYVHKSTAEKFGQRAYKAGKLNRLTNDWVATSDSIHREVRSEIVPVRSRARDLHKNNAYVRGFFLDNRANIIGPKGPTLQVRAKDSNGNDDAYTNDLIESKFEEWCEPEYCTMAGVLDFVEVQWLLANQLKRDGEFIVRMITGMSVNKFGFSLQLIEPDALDEKFTMKLSNGNYAIMGVEINEWKKPVAFWLRTQNAETEYMGVYGFNYQPTANTYGLQRIPAEEILFAFDPEYTNQQRGMSHLAATMLTIHNLQGYDEAAIINARAGASKMGFFHSADNAAPPEYQGDEVDDDGNELTDFAAGTFEDIGDKRFTAFNPDYPNNEYAPFRKEHLRESAIGLGRNYNSFAGDLESVSFSSLRGGELSQRQMWMVDQELFIKKLNKRVYKNLLKWALLTSEINLPYSKYNNYVRHEWQPVRWPWVDPYKDVQAAVMAIDHGLSTRTDELAKQGKDFTNVITRLGKENIEAENNNVRFGEVTNGKIPAGTDPEETDGQDTASSTDSGSGDGEPGRSDGRILRVIGSPV